MGFNDLGYLLRKEIVVDLQDFGHFHQAKLGKLLCKRRIMAFLQKI